MPRPSDRWCQCEHRAHAAQPHNWMTPNGNPGHKYGVAFDRQQVVEVKTPFGRFTVCKDCAADCLAEFKEEPNA